MSDNEWIYELQSWDTGQPVEKVEDPTYTVYRGDFLRMPDVNFIELAAYDPDIQALMN